MASVAPARNLFCEGRLPPPPGGRPASPTDPPAETRAPAPAAGVEDELERLRQQARQAERLREADEMRSRFINAAAHELRTPLTPIRLQLHLLRSFGVEALTPEQRKSLEILERNVERLNHLIQDVLDGARLQTGRLRVARTVLDLNGVVRDAAESFQEPARQVGVDLALDVGAPLPVEGDATRLAQVLFNLLSNAIKFTPRGGWVRVEAGRGDGAAFVRVRDNGLGLAPEQLARLFQPFTQVHDESAAKHSGSGLGLYISRGITELHGGRLWAQSEGPGRGAVFQLDLPLSPRPLGEVAGSQGRDAPRALDGRIRDLI